MDISGPILSLPVKRFDPSSLDLPIFGFGLLRNGIKYDYPFRESLISLSHLCQSVYLALGDSDDQTQAAINDLDFLHITPTHWDPALRSGGQILSEQTNTALTQLRLAQGHQKNAWGIYLQCDEVFHEEEEELIACDLEKAQEQGCDAVSFRYLHFWQNHHQLAINKKWYPHEIRAIKLNSHGESWGDAQSFRYVSKIYQSEASIYHYGHVRNHASYRDKKYEMLRLYHGDRELPKYRRRERRFDRQTECLPFLGNHPSVMKDRILRFGDHWQVPLAPPIYIVGDQKDYDAHFLSKIHAGDVHWKEAVGQVPLDQRSQIIMARPPRWPRPWVWRWICDRGRAELAVPTQMRSKLARPWSGEMLLTLKLSCRGVGLHPLGQTQSQTQSQSALGIQP